MDPHLFQKLTATEVQHYAGELDAAIEQHSRWLARINRVLICADPPPPEDIGEAPDRRCPFGRWYHGVDSAAIRDLPKFAAIDGVHRDVHESAKGLLYSAQRHEVITPERYDHFVDASNRLRGLLADLRDEFKRNLGIMSKLMGQVFENASEAVLITDPNGTIVSVNSAFTEVTGYSAEEAIGETPNLLYSGRQDDDFYRRMWTSLVEEGAWQGEIWNRRKNGDVYPESLSIAAVRDSEGQISHYVAIFSDITTEKETEERLYHLAHYDPLTNLPNRMCFLDQLRQAVARARRNGSTVAVLFLDLDGFKPINDTLGHAAGDRLLDEVGRRLRDALRTSDTVGRFGGDEFTVVLPDLDEHDDVAHVADKLTAAIARPFDIDGNACHITTSVGISRYPVDGSDAEQLIRRADLAMYAAKKAGKHRHAFFDPTLE